MPNILDALNQVSSVDELKSAYEIDHPTVEAQVTVEPDEANGIVVQGVFLDRKSRVQVGWFKRRITISGNGRFIIEHRYITVDAKYERHGVSRDHYTRAIRYYHNVLNAAYVTMSATYDGPYVWGDFGFEFTAKDWAILLNRFEDIYRSIYNAAPESFPESATELAHARGPDEIEVGIEAIRAVHHSKPELKMFLDLSDGDALQFLREERILEP